MKRMVWTGLGWAFLGIGGIGIVLPLLPTTPFVLLAAFAFTRGSPRLRAWLEDHPRFGPPIRDWEDFGAIAPRAKRLACALMAATFVLSAAAGLAPALLLVQAALLSVGAAYVVTRPDAPAPGALRIRPARASELTALAGLCLRSKAHWGYDPAFLEACRAELGLSEEELETTSIAVAERERTAVGVAQVQVTGDTADLLKLFVEPEEIGKGYGGRLFTWAAATARRGGATRMTIEADPDAEPFYRRMGAVRIGEAPSRSIPGRSLPLLEIPLLDPAVGRV